MSQAATINRMLHYILALAHGSPGHYLSLGKAAQEPGAVVVDAESRDGPVLGTHSSAAQTQPQSLVLI